MLSWKTHIEHIYIHIVIYFPSNQHGVYMVTKDSTVYVKVGIFYFVGKKTSLNSWYSTFWVFSSLGYTLFYSFMKQQQQKGL